MIWPSVDIDGEEGSRLSMGNVVCPGNVNRQVDDVIDEEVVCPVGVDGDVNNQLCSFDERGVIVNGHLLQNQMLVWGKEVVGVPVLGMQDSIC